MAKTSYKDLDYIYGIESLNAFHKAFSCGGLEKGFEGIAKTDRQIPKVLQRLLDLDQVTVK